MPKKVWSSEDDQKLINLVNEYIKSSHRIRWKIIGNKINKPPSSCFSRYTRCLSPNVSGRNSKWTQDEDLIINNLRQEKKSWTEIKRFLPGRSDLAIFNRWRSNSKKTGCKKPPIEILIQKNQFATPSQLQIQSNPSPPSEKSAFFFINYKSSKITINDSPFNDEIDFFESDGEDDDDDYLNYRMDISFITNNN
ncbi:hypothetical protein DICPUDRAFT_77336 [Dictyostelium purpureum]|uniref:Myb-like domain-containing protein n=1 Tax=Dictyostelium purpureum TaxID=5786 RepID=F0ZGB2_DICPU|nr:uncharacterized protein DICPUDRAFT_77336 [Dictyostelium purpureum]EGC37013.1 hypothetical protein DICPUDRAFT_77336 [Dictyostelium purpureum]|eukprot:XP_003286441.1 hypothetical protein DICPUDRAFT_77336 [Dictyostelium purpureum]